MKALLLLHLAASVALLGASGHSCVAAWQIARGAVAKARLFRVYGTIVGILYPLTLLMGAWIYPTFRLSVRAAGLDAELPWATGLFEIKEHLAGLGIALVLLQLWIGGQPPERVSPRLRVVVAALLFLTVLWSAGSGALLVSLRSV